MSGETLPTGDLPVLAALALPDTNCATGETRRSAQREELPTAEELHVLGLVEILLKQPRRADLFSLLGSSLLDVVPRLLGIALASYAVFGLTLALLLNFAPAEAMPHRWFPIPGASWRDGSALVNRRRILRRGLPYGGVDAAAPDDAGEHGIIFLAICTSLFRQFEFVQQQWMQYGLDFNAGSDTCPIVGNHDPEHDPKMVIVEAPDSGREPFLCDRIPQLVEPRGGDYFFIPSMTALRMIGMGTIDPT